MISLTFFLNSNSSKFILVIIRQLSGLAFSFKYKNKGDAEKINAESKIVVRNSGEVCIR